MHSFHFYSHTHNRFHSFHCSTMTFAVLQCFRLKFAIVEHLYWYFIKPFFNSINLVRSSPKTIYKCSIFWILRLSHSLSPNCIAIRLVIEMSTACKKFIVFYRMNVLCTKSIQINEQHHHELFTYKSSLKLENIILENFHIYTDQIRNFFSTHRGMKQAVGISWC